jgi:hypothetical protein
MSLLLPAGSCTDDGVIVGRGRGALVRGAHGSGAGKLGRSGSDGAEKCAAGELSFFCFFFCLFF